MLPTLLRCKNVKITRFPICTLKKVVCILYYYVARLNVIRSSPFQLLNVTAQKHEKKREGEGKKERKKKKDKNIKHELWYLMIHVSHT